MRNILDRSISLQAQRITAEDGIRTDEVRMLRVADLPGAAERSARPESTAGTGNYL
jgi:hypothetical protein